MKKKLIFGSTFILSASLILFVGCNPQVKGEGTNKNETPAAKKDQFNKAESAKNQKKVEETKKYSEEKPGKTSPTSSINNEVPDLKNSDKVSVEKPAVKTDETLLKSLQEKKENVIEQVKKNIANESKPLDIPAKPLDITKEEKEIKKDIMEQVVQAKEKSKTKTVQEEEEENVIDDETDPTLDNETDATDTDLDSNMPEKTGKTKP